MKEELSFKTLSFSLFFLYIACINEESNQIILYISINKQSDFNETRKYAINNVQAMVKEFLKPYVSIMTNSLSETFD